MKYLKGFSNLSTPIAVVLAGLMIAGAVIYANSGSSNNQNGNVDIAQQPQPGQPNPAQAGPVDMDTIDTEGWAVLGDANAPVTIVEYSDYACPFCGRFWEETLPLIKEQYIDAGLVNFIYKDFAVVGGDKAAEAAHCAGDQGNYYGYHDILFENQAVDSQRWGTADVHRGYAESLGLNADELVECFESGRNQAKVAASTQEAISVGGQGTPYFLVNGEPVAGAQPFAAFQPVIEAALTDQ